jgi:ABC-type Fe3+/spermidine/putrescine transport system ATPase subunit
MSQLIVDGIGKVYLHTKQEGGFELSPISFTLESGQLLAIIGPSGCGKTTLLRCLAGLLHQDCGKVIVDGFDVSQQSAETRRFGMLFQQALVFPHLTVAENIGFGLKMRGVPSKQRKVEVERYLDAVELSGFGDRMTDTLSGGQQQRVAIARAFILQPQILLLDEPFAALDPITRDEMRELLKKMQQQFSCTVLMVTHDRDEAFAMADQMAIMDKGQLLQIGSPFELYVRPKSTRAAELMGCENIFYGHKKGEWFESESLHLRAFQSSTDFDGEGVLIVRPETIQIGGSDIQATVEQVSARQGYYLIYLRVIQHQLIMRLPFGAGSIPEKGAAIGLLIDWQYSHWIPHDQTL